MINQFLRGHSTAVFPTLTQLIEFPFSLLCASMDFCVSVTTQTFFESDNRHASIFGGPGYILADALSVKAFSHRDG